MWYFENDNSRLCNYNGEKLCQELTNVPKVTVKN